MRTMADIQTELSLVLTCYNESAYIESSVQEIYKVLTSTCKRFEIIIVDDGSVDGSVQIIEKLSQNLEQVRSIILPKNKGRGHAFRTGAEKAKGDIIGYLDLDLEISCNYIPSAIQALEGKEDIVTIRRSYGLNFNPTYLLRQMLSFGYMHFMAIYLGIQRMDTEAGFKFFKREPLLAILPEVKSCRWFFDTEIMVLASKKGYKINELSGQVIRRAGKTSSVRIWQDGLDHFRELIRLKSRLR